MKRLLRVISITRGCEDAMSGINKVEINHAKSAILCSEHDIGCTQKHDE